MRNLMIVKRVINIVVLTVWVVTQTSMLFAHPITADLGAQSHPVESVHSHMHSHAGQHDMAGTADHGDDGSNSSDPCMAGMECCGSTCTVDAQPLTCPLGSAGVARQFNGAKVVALTAAELGSQTPPPNTTI